MWRTLVNVVYGKDTNVVANKSSTLACSLLLYLVHACKVSDVSTPCNAIDNNSVFLCKC